MKQNFRTHALLTENKIEWLKNHFKDKPFETDFDMNAEHRDTDAIIDHFAKHDPNPKKSNTQWILNQYRKQNLRQEDAESVHASLSNFEKYKGKLEKKDINQYAHRSELDAAVLPHLGQAASRKEEKRGMGALIHEDPSGLKVFKVRNAEEATHFSKECTRHTGVPGGHGGGTAAFCTVSPNMFNNYMDSGRYGGIEKDPLYVIHTSHPDPLKQRYQFHFGSQQFADPRDSNVGLAQVVKDHPGLRDVKDFEGKHPFLETPQRLNAKVASGHQYPGYQSAIKMDHSSKFLTSDTLDAAAKHGKNLADIAGHPNARPELIHDIALKDKSSHQSVADNPSAQGHTLAHVVEHNPSSESILSKVAEHPNATPVIIGNIAEKGAPTNSAVKKAAAHPNLPNDVRERLLTKPEHYVNLLGNPTLSDDHVERISQHAAGLSTGPVRNAIEEKLAAHPQTGTHHLDRLARGSSINHLAASAALSNPRLPVATLEDLAHPDSFSDKGRHAVHAAIAKNQHAPEHVLSGLASHPLAFVASTASKTLAAKKK